MSAVRSMLKRVAQLEQARAPRPFPFPMDDPDFIEGKGLDETEWPLIIKALRRWEADGVYAGWQRGSNRVWHL
jgi:hypothetical protein